MIRNTLCLLSSVFIIALFSCKKGKHDPTTVTPIDSPVVVTYDNYTALKPGNYWIYQDYRLDSINGEAHPLGSFDSSFVEKDTVIGSQAYHKYYDVNSLPGETPTYGIYYFRDSLSYTVNEAGFIQFSSQDFTNIFRTFTFGPNMATPDTLLITEQMGFKDAAVVVDAGIFTTSSFRRIYHFPAGYPFGTIREYDHKYAKNIGLVSETSGFYTSLPMLYEKRLVRYHVQ